MSIYWYTHSAADSQLTVMSTVCTSASISFTAVHSYVPALCLEIDGISRYSSSDARSPMKDHMHKMENGHSGLMRVNSCLPDWYFHSPCVTAREVGHSGVKRKEEGVDNEAIIKIT